MLPFRGEIMLSSSSSQQEVRYSEVRYSPGQTHAPCAIEGIGFEAWLGAIHIERLQISHHLLEQH